MIRFGIVLSVVLIAIGLLVTGTVTGSLLLVMVSIGVAALAALMLLLVVLIWRREIFGVQLAGSEQTARRQASPEPAMAAAGAPARAGAASGRAGGAPGRAGYPVPAAARADASGNEADVLVKPAAAGEAGAAGATKVRVPTSHAAPSDRRVRSGRPLGTPGGRRGDQSGAVVPDDGRSAGKRRSGAPERRGATGSAPAGAPAAPAAPATPPAPAVASAEPVRRNADRTEGDTARRDRPERPERQGRSEPDRSDADKAAAARAGADSLFGARAAARRPDSDGIKPDPVFGGRGVFGGRDGPAGEPRRAATEAAGGRPSRDSAATPSAVVKPGDESGQPKPARSSPEAGQPEEATPRAAAPKVEPARAEPPKASAPRTDLSRAADRPAERRSSPPTPATKPAVSLTTAENRASADTAAKAAPAAPSVTPPVASPDRKPAAPTVPKEAAADSGKPAAKEGGQSTTPAPASAAPASTAPASAGPASAGPAKDREPPPAPGASAGSIRVRVVPGIARYHAQGCILIRFLAPEDLEVISLEAAASEGYVACKACKPDQAAAQAASS